MVTRTLPLLSILIQINITRLQFYRLKIFFNITLPSIAYVFKVVLMAPISVVILLVVTVMVVVVVVVVVVFVVFVIIGNLNVMPVVFLHTYYDYLGSKQILGFVIVKTIILK